MDCFFNIFDAEKASKIYSAAELAIKKNNMQDLIEGGVVVGFSGGADSVMLLLVLLEYRRRHRYFPILALHVNHMIRGEEAQRDENFTQKFCLQLGVDYKCTRIDIPTIAKTKHKGIEETAREERYSEFFYTLSENRDKYSSIAVAHNSTDNLETIILNMMRGTGISGLSGIQPIRDNIVRPLIYSSKDDIRDALNTTGVIYMLDSTNQSSDYTRNYIRHEIIPKFEKLNSDPETMGTRLSENLREDADFIDSYVKNFIKEKFVDDCVKCSDLSAVHKAVFFRILTYMMRQYCISKGIFQFCSPEKTHVDLIYSKLQDGNFSYCLPSGMSFVSSYGKCYIEKTSVQANDLTIPKTALKMGLNRIEGFSSAVLLSEDKYADSYSNVYKISIQMQIPFDIINGNLYLRSKFDGDSYNYSNMTHKLKKLFCDRKIPCNKRMSVPVICDEIGILWVPGFGVRGTKVSSSERKLYISILDLLDDSSSNNKLFFKK